MDTRGLAERIEYVRRHVATHIVEHTGVPIPSLSWVALSQAEWTARSDLSAIDLTSGWSSPELEDANDPDGPIVVRYCPEVIVATTAHMPLSPEPDGHRPWADDPNLGMQSISYLDNYVRCVEHVLDMEIVLFEDHPDPVLRRQAAESALYEVHPLALRLISFVQSAAIAKVSE